MIFDFLMICGIAIWIVMWMSYGDTNSGPDWDLKKFF
jgi:hypothetical protein